jgi:outer membrane protein with beta-barrel domain
MHLIKIKPFFVLFIFISLFSSALIAQEAVQEVEEKSDCVIKLEQAQAKFDQGRIQDVEPLIAKCLEGKEFNKAEKTQALKLLTLTYLFLEEPELAEANMLRLLETSHEFTVNQAIDPSEFINLYNKYRTEPLYSIGLLVGGVAATPIVTQLNSTRDLNNNVRQKYTPLVGIRVGANGEYKLFDKVYVNAGLNLTTIKFQKNHENFKPVITNTDGSPTKIGEFEGVETQTSIELPILIQYHILKAGIITFFGAAGVAPQYTIAASYPGETITYAIDGSADVTSTNVSLDNDRNKFNLSAVAVAGFKLKVFEGFFTAQLRYSHNIFQNAKGKYALTPNNPNLLWDLTESYDGFRLHDVGISVGYTLHFYKPKKLR